MNADSVPSERLRDRIAHIVGAQVVDARRPLGGYTPAERWVLELSDGRTAFAKTGTDLGTSLVATWLRVEHRAYAEIHGAFMPEVRWWEDTGDQPLLIL